MAQRTPAMTAFSVLSIAVGAFFTVMSLRMIVSGPGEGGAAEAVGATGVVATMIWAGAAVASLLMLVSGVGMFKAATWHRHVTMACALVGLLVFGAWFVTSHFGVLAGVALAYTVVLGATCLSPNFTTGAASATGSTTGSTGPTTGTTHAPAQTSAPAESKQTSTPTDDEKAAA